MSTAFTPYTLRQLTLKNRIVVAPMCQYSAIEGLANDWHFAHLARFALGGFGLVIVEAAAVSDVGRISYGDLGIYADRHIEPLRRIVDFLHSQGTAAGIQLAHAGRKASSPIPWRGGVPEREDEKAAVAFADWVPVAPSAVPHMPAPSAYKVPQALDLADMAALREDFVAAARRADQAGFDVVEIHAAHGYGLNQFLSPVANRREDEYGGSLENRMRFPLEVVSAVRAAWPAHKPLFVRISVTDWIEGGWTPEDSVVFCRAMAARGVDLVDCSSGGFHGAAVQPAPHYQVPLAKRIRDAAGVPTMAVGLITDAAAAEAIIAHGEADLVALARQALDDPNWPLHAQLALDGSEASYAAWPKQAGYAVKAMDRALGRRAFTS